MAEKAGRARPQTGEPAVVLAQVYDPMSSEDSEGYLVAVASALWARRFLLLALAVLFGVCGVIVSAFVPKVYRAKASLLLRPPSFSTELKPIPFTVETYKSILESDYVVSRIRDELVAEQVIPSNTGLESIKSQLSVLIYAGRETEQPGERPFIPIIDLVAESNDPEIAAKTANKWAQVFLAENAGLFQALKKSTVDFIETQYPNVSTALAEKEAELSRREDYYARRRFELQTRWDRQIQERTAETKEKETAFANETLKLQTDFLNETTRQAEEYKKETERLRLNFLRDWQRDLSEQKLTDQKAKLNELRADLLATEFDLKTKGDTVKELREELDQQPEVLTLAKAISDDALWNRVEQGGAGLKELETLRLRTEVINPSHRALLDRFLAAQVDYKTLLPRRDHLVSEIARIETLVEEGEAEFTQRQIEFFNLTESRDNGLARLNREGAQELRTLGKTRETQLENMVLDHTTELARMEEQKVLEIEQSEREGGVEVGKLKREADDARKAYTMIAEKHQSAQLAKAEEEGDVRIGSLAVPPEKPESIPLAANFALSGLAGLLLGCLGVVFVDFKGLRQQTSPAPQP